MNKRDRWSEGERGAKGNGQEVERERVREHTLPSDTHSHKTGRLPTGHTHL